MNRKIIFILAGLLLSSQAGNLHAKARCSQFESQAEAQRYMLEHGAHYLDRDKDGEACECLPGGSRHGDSICKL